MGKFVENHLPIIVALRLGGLSTTWYTKQTVLYEFYCLALNLICAVFLISAIAPVAVYRVEMLDVARLGILICMHFTSFGYVIYSRLNALDIIQLLRDIDHATSYFADCGLMVEENDKLENKLLRKYTTQVAKVTGVCAVCYCIPFLIDDYSKGCYGVETAYKVYAPFRYDRVGLKEFIVALQILGLLIPGIQKVVYESFLVHLIRLQMNHFKLLSQSFSGVLNETDRIFGKSSNKIKTPPQGIISFKQWTDLHRLVLKNSRSMIKIFSPVIVINYITMITSVACLLFLALKDKRRNITQIIGSGTYSCVNLVQIFLLSMFSDRLTCEAQEVAKSVYFSNWRLVKSRKTMMNVKLIQCVANKALVVTAYSCNVFKLNATQFRALVSSTITTFIGLMKLEDIINST